MIKTAQLIMELDQKSKYQDAQKLRGFFANTFTKIDLFHNHKVSGESIYRYPKIQYRFLNNRPTVFAFDDGVELIKTYYDNFDSIFIGSYKYPIMEKQLNFSEQELQVVDDLFYYQFISPWYALNQDNYESYKNLNTNKEREKLLEKVLIGNILSMCKGMNYHVNEQIEVQTFLRPLKSVVKDIKVVSFTGNIKINMLLPEYIGLGKAVSRGFGTIIKTNK
jgi:hypothetical protein